MEGKAVLFKEFGGVNAVPICLDTQDTEEIIKSVVNIAPAFGGINLEDISAPRCFEIETRLKELLNIPVFHDDQHGTAIVVLAGIINALKVTGKKKEDCRVVVNGAGSAGVAITKLLLTYGFPHITMCDINGIISKNSPNLNWMQQQMTEVTNLEERTGTLADALKGADIFVGVSAPNIVSKEMVASMNKDAILFAMANPVPEIMPDLAKEAGAKVVGTGRSDFPNQVNNVVAFPGIFKGALEGRATQITEEMKLAAANAIAGLVPEEELNENNILPINPQKYKHIIVTGKNAHGYVHGGGSGAVVPFHYTNLFDGIQKEGKLNNVKVEYIDELDFMPSIMYTDDNLNEKGFHAEYFKNIHFEGAPVVKQTEKKINYSWAAGTELEGMPKDYFSVKWYSTMCVDETADYEFTLGGDDGYKLFINDQPIIDDWTPGGFRTTNVTKTLKAGEKYHVRVEYYQQGGGAGICFLWKRKNETQNKFADYLNKADLVIACFGHSSDTEGEASDRTFELPEVDKKMLASLSGCKKPVIGIVNAGGNIEMQKWEPSLKGLIWGFYGGQEAGTAIGEALFGKVNPSGKLPMTFEKKWEDSPAYNSYHDPDKDKHVAYTEGIFIGYRGYDKLKREVQYPFGYGLSYTTFKLSNIVVSKPNADGTVEVTCRLANTGKRDGAQVIQAYVGKAENSPVERPQKELRKFEKIFLKAGESTTVKMTLPKESFMYFDVNRTQFVTDPGIYNIMLGFSSRDIKAQKNIQYTL